jgi:hypothetical protein
MMPERAKMPGPFVGYIVSSRLGQVNLAGISIPTNNAKKEAFRASGEGMLYGFRFNSTILSKFTLLRCHQSMSAFWYSLFSFAMNLTLIPLGHAAWHS